MNNEFEKGGNIEFTVKYKLDDVNYGLVPAFTFYLNHRGFNVLKMNKDGGEGYIQLDYSKTTEVVAKIERKTVNDMPCGSYQLEIYDSDHILVKSYDNFLILKDSLIKAEQ